jgi:hypothetical protein
VICCPPEFDHAPCDERFRSLFDARLFDGSGVCGRIWWWVEVFQAGNLDVVAVIVKDINGKIFI